LSAGDRVAAVISVFNPPRDLPDRVARLAGQVELVVAVDDGSPQADPTVLDGLSRVATLVRLPANSGIAVALNTGITHAREAIEPDWLLTLDQDSELDEGFVARALETARRAQTAGLRVGAVTPESHNGRRIDMLRAKDEFRDGFDPMQSGTLISNAAAEHIGLLEEGLFIDAVDSEYTARLRRAGYRVIAGEGCNITHSVGQSRPMRVLGRRVRIGGNDLNVYYHSPFRVYYISRNSIRLTRKYLLSQPGWIAKRLMLETAFHGIRFVFGPNRRKLLLAFLSGTADGLCGRKGRIPAGVEKRINR
jgi:rhamnosyltransferase